MTRFVTVIALTLGLSVACKSDKKEKPKEAGKTTSTNVPSEAKPKPKPVEARTPKANAEVVDRYGKAYMEADEAALRELLHKDVVFELPDAMLFASSEPQKGIETDIESAKRMKAGFENSYEPSQLTLATKDKVAIILRLHGTGKAENPVEALRGKSASVWAAQVFSVDKDGKITHAVSLMDDASVAHQLGLHEDEGASERVKSWGAPEVALATGSEVEQANLEKARQNTKLLAAMDTEAIAAGISEPLILHDTADPKPIVFKTRDDFKKRHAAQKDFFEVVSRETEEMFAAGDWVFERTKQTIRLTKDPPDMKGVKGKTVTRTGFSFIRFKDGLVTEVRTFVNDLQMQAQLGAVDADELRAKLRPAKAKEAK